MIHCAIPQPAVQRLHELGLEQKKYWTRVASEILTTELIGGLWRQP